MNTQPTEEKRGRPQLKAKREAVAILLNMGRKPADVRDATGASLNMIYEIRRAIASQKAEQAA
jgi:uncharacterized protein YerC